MTHHFILVTVTQVTPLRACANNIFRYVLPYDSSRVPIDFYIRSLHSLHLHLLSCIFPHLFSFLGLAHIPVRVLFPPLSQRGTHSNKGIAMPSTPTTFELSDENAATQHNFNESPLLRLPAELRNKIWNLCLSNAHVRISGHLLNYKTSDLEVQVHRLDAQLGFVFDLTRHPPFTPCYRPNPSRPKPVLPAVPTDDLTSFTHDVSYDITPSSPAHSGKEAKFPERLPQLWRVCKSAYNETIDIPFAGNMFHFTDWPSFILFHKYQPHVMGRIKNLAFSSTVVGGLERRLRRLLEVQIDGSPKLVSIDEQIRHRKSNLLRVLPALTALCLERQCSAQGRAMTDTQADVETWVAGLIEHEMERASKSLPFWEPLVERVTVVVSPTTVEQALRYRESFLSGNA